MQKNQLPLFDDELNLYYTVKKIISTDGYDESYQLKILNKSLNLIRSSSDYFLLLKKTFKNQSGECFNLLLSNLNNNVESEDILNLLEFCLETDKASGFLTGTYYIDYKSRLNSLIKHIDSELFSNPKNNKKIKKIILMTINNDDMYLFSLLNSFKIKLNTDLIIEIMNDLLLSKNGISEIYFFNMAKELSSISDQSKGFYYQMTDVLLEYYFSEDAFKTTLYKEWNNHLSEINIASGLLDLDIVGKESLFIKHTKCMPANRLWFFIKKNPSLDLLGISKLSYDNNDNVMHKIISTSSIGILYSIFSKVIDSQSLRSLLFKKNDYNQTPLNYFISLGQISNENISILIYILKTVITNKLDDYEDLLAFEENASKEWKNIINFDKDSFKEHIDRVPNNSVGKNDLIMIKADLNRFYPADKTVYHKVFKEEDIKKQEEEAKLNDETSKAMLSWIEKLRSVGFVKKYITNNNLEKNIEELRATFPNFSEFIDYIENYMYLNNVGNGFFHLPPALLISPPGIGKTFFLHTLAKMVGVDNSMISMESVTSGFILTGLGSQWSSGQPGLVFKNIYNAKYANNILILDEIDKCSDGKYNIDSVLLPLLESHTAKNFKDEYMNIPMDISKTVWVATANNIAAISEPIKSRFQLFEIKKPTFNERKILIQAIYKSLLKDHTWGDSFEKTIEDDVLNEMAQDGNSSRDIRKLILQACGKAARRLDKQIKIEDLEVKQMTDTSIWDKRNEH